MKTGEFRTACFQCGKKSNLMMLAHRHDVSIVGWIFICNNCFKVLANTTLKISIVHE